MNLPSIQPLAVIHCVTDWYQNFIPSHLHTTADLEEHSPDTMKGYVHSEKRIIQGKISSESNRKECEAFNCFAEATTSIEVKAGHERTISLSLCKNCIKKFAGGD